MANKKRGPGQPPLAVGAPVAARLIGVSESHFYTRLAGGGIPPGFGLGKGRLWSVYELRRWIAVGEPNAQRWAVIKADALRLPPG